MSTHGVRCTVTDTASPFSTAWICSADSSTMTLSTMIKHSCGLLLIVFQQPAQPLTALHRVLTSCSLANRRQEHHIALALMIPLVMVMRHVFMERMPQRGLPKQDQPGEGFLFDGAHPPLREGVQIR